MGIIGKEGPLPRTLKRGWLSLSFALGLSPRQSKKTRSADSVAAGADEAESGLRGLVRSGARIVRRQGIVQEAQATILPVKKGLTGF